MFQQIVRSLSKLSLVSPVSSALTGNIQTRSVQTSRSLLHSLDARRSPPSREPSTRTRLWKPRKKMSEMYEYTVKRLPFPKSSGRGPNGRIFCYARMGGVKRKFRMIDWNRPRLVTENSFLEEKVLAIKYDPMRSARIALVGTGEEKRYIIATQNMKPGDIIKTGTKLTDIPVKASEGDAYPVGSLPIGSLVNSVERLPGEGGRVACAAGTQAQIIRKMGDKVVIKMPSKREIAVSQTCMATVGRVGNIDHNKRIIGKAGRNRWLGFKPSSGKWHRKDGRFGRKIRAIRPMVNYDKPKRRDHYVLQLDGSSPRKFLNFHNV